MSRLELHHETWRGSCFSSPVLGSLEMMGKVSGNASNLAINQKPDDAGRGRFQGKVTYLFVFVLFSSIETPWKTEVSACE